MSKHSASINSWIFFQLWSTKLTRLFKHLIIVSGNILEGFNNLKNVAEFKSVGSLSLCMGLVCLVLVGFFLRGERVFFGLFVFWFFFLVFVDLVYKISFEIFSFQQLLDASFVPILASKLHFEENFVFTTLESTLKKKKIKNT